MSAFFLLSIGFTLGFLVAACFQVGAVADGWEAERRKLERIERMWETR